MTKKLFAGLLSLVMTVTVIATPMGDTIDGFFEKTSLSVKADSEITDNISDVDKILFYDNVNQITNIDSQITINAEDATDEVINSYSNGDQNLAAVLTALRNGDKILLSNLLSKLYLGDNYETQLKKKAVNLFLNEAIKNDVGFAEIVNKVDSAYSQSKEIVDCMETMHNELLKKGMTKEEIEEFEKKLNQCNDTIYDHMNKAYDKSVYIAKFGIEVYELYKINLDYVEKLMNSIPANSTLFESLNLIRDDMLNKTHYIINKFLTDTSIKFICKILNDSEPTSAKIVGYCIDFFCEYICDLASADDIIITYLNNDFTFTLKTVCIDKLTYMKKNGSDDDDIKSFKFRYDNYIASLKAELKSAQSSAKKYDTTLKDNCNKAYNELNSWNSKKLIDYIFGLLHTKGKIQLPLAPESDFEIEVTDSKNKKAKITKYKGEGGFITIPNTINGFTITSFLKHTFKNCSSLIGVTIPNSVTSIGDSAFEYCSNLTSVTIPDSVTSIGSFAFWGTVLFENQTTDVKYAGNWAVYCDNEAKSVSIKAGTVGIADDAFYINGLTSVTIPNSVKYIGDYAFYDSVRLTSITIPNSVKSIGSDAFGGACSSLTSVTMGNNVTSIGSDAFDGTAFLKNQTTSVKYAGNWAVDCDYKAESVSIKAGTVGIADDAFYNNSNLKSVTIPNSVKYIGGHAFYECKSLTNTTIPNSVTDIGWGAFSDCRSLTSVTIPNGVTSIEDYAFYGCENLESITIPDSVTSIESAAFMFCKSLTSITIPNSVTSIGDSAFRYCPSLKNVIVPNSITYMGSSIFKDTPLEDYETGCRYAGKWVVSCSLNAASVTLKSDTVGIANSAFTGYFDEKLEKITSITIPNSVTWIGDGAFENCTSLKDIYYTGTKEEWNKISIGLDNYRLENSTIHYNYKPNHQHNYTSKITKQPTCTTSGTQERKCSVCGNVETKEIPALGHKFSSWKTTKKATCTATGKQTRKCSVCGKTETKTIAKTSHSYKKVSVASTYFTKGYTANKCSKCGAISNKKYTSLKTMSAPKASSSTTNSIKLTWSKVSGAKGYIVYQKKNGKWSKIKTTTATSYTVQKLKAGTTYQFCIKPYKISGGKYVYGNSSKTLSKTTSYMTYSKYKYKFVGSNVEIAKYTGKESNVTIPKTIKGKKVVYIGSKAFAGNNNLKSVVIPSNVTTIKNSAFDSCKNLSKVTIQSGVKKIEYYAFNMCLKLKSIKIPKSVTSMEEMCVGFAIDEKYHSMNLNYTDKFKIYCYKNSTAHKYAKNMEIKYSIIK